MCVYEFSNTRNPHKNDERWQNDAVNSSTKPENSTKLIWFALNFSFSTYENLSKMIFLFVDTASKCVNDKNDFPLTEKISECWTLRRTRCHLVAVILYRRVSMVWTHSRNFVCSFQIRADGQVQKRFIIVIEAAVERFLFSFFVHWKQIYKFFG